jgi:hypothetical protein
MEIVNHTEMTLFRLLLSDKLDSSSTDDLIFFLIGDYHEVFEIAGLNISETLSEKVGVLWKHSVHDIAEWIDRTVARFSVKPLTPVQYSWILYFIVFFSCYFKSYALDEISERLISIGTKQRLESLS